MKCLVVGGTGFLGGAICDVLADNGHSVAILTRGVTARETVAAVEVIHADRHGDLGVLRGREFDWVFDSCAFAPDAVTSILNAVGSGIQRYIMISSISAYGEFREPGLKETVNVPDATAEDIELAASLPPQKRASASAYGQSYGRLKRACEIRADQLLGNRMTALRVGLLVGAGDYSDRLTWWVRRIDQAKGDLQKVPAPGPKTRPLQLVDARDVADFALLCAVTELSGIWNVTGQPQQLSQALDAIVDVTGSPAELVWVNEEAINKADITPWIDMPMMAPTLPAFRHFLEVSTEKARAAGLSCRPLEDTLRPLLEWDRMRRDMPLKGGMTRAQETSLLKY